MTSSKLNPLVMRSPAKINLFVHVTGQRGDGYHLLETVFQFLDFADILKFESIEDNRIIRYDNHDFSLPQNDLIIRAAELLREKIQPNNASGNLSGVKISLTKKIPPGSGMGGGSSNAATTLLALNRLWHLDLSRNELLSLSAQLGADVPVFIYAKSCWATGIGNIFESFEPPQYWYCICIPSVAVSTARIFAHPQLQRTHRPISKVDFHNGHTSNDLEPVTRLLHPQVDQALNALAQYGNAKMNGSGSSLYLRCACQGDANEIRHQLPPHLKCVVARTLNDITEY